MVKVTAFVLVVSFNIMYCCDSDYISVLPDKVKGHEGW